MVEKKRNVFPEISGDCVVETGQVGTRAGGVGGGDLGCPQGTHFRNDIISGPGGQQILAEDPAGNPIELFQPA